jgi:thiol-disulfide isomerase/thioredoxin
MRSLAVSAVLLLLSCAAARADNVTVTGRVTDAAGKPAAGVELASFWMVEGDNMKAYQGVTTDAEGRFSIKLSHYGRPVAVLGLDHDRKTGGLFTVDPKAARKEVTLKLGPLVRVKGSFFCKELNFKPTWTNVYMMTPDDARFVQCASKEAAFSFLLPPGTYKFWGYGTDIQNVKQNLTVAADKPEVDLQTVEAKATPIAKHKGKAPPKWHVTDARGVKKEVSLDDYKGKWVLVDFFTHWCGPCVARSIPNLIELYDEHRDHRDKFEILAFHVQYATDFDDYDQKIKNAKKKYWNDQELPFPLLLDATKETLEAYGIHAFPTTILIDPEGKLVGEVSEEELEKKLPPVPAALRVPRALNRPLSMGMDDTQTLQQNIAFLARVARVDIRLDDSALKAAGEKIPLQLSGSLTLHSWLNLVLAAPDLTFKTDDKGVVVTAKNAAAEAAKPSVPQKMSVRRIEEILNKKESFDFNDATLADVIQRLEQITSESFVLDPAARKAGRLNPEMKVSGRSKHEPLRESLQKLLDPLSLTFVVRDEVVLITPRAQR